MVSPRPFFWAAATLAPASISLRLEPLGRVHAVRVSELNLTSRPRFRSASR